MSEKPTFKIPTVKNVRTLASQGPWTTKSNGQLSVLFGLDFARLDEGFFRYEQSELARAPRDIRGLRSYKIAGMRNRSLGANEWHRIRQELVFVIKGSVKWTCEDALGNCADFTLDNASGVWVPSFILHVYETLEDDSQILVIANTLFSPDEPNTHDTYGADDFKKLQEQYRIE